jgi:DNA polymerase III subunit gamma/tau
LQTTHLSINQLIEQQKEKSAVSADNLPKKPFDRDDLVRIWKTLAHTEKLNGNDPIYHVMIKRDPQQIDATHYHFEVDNAMQHTRMENAMSDIMPKLRQELENYDLEIVVEVTKDEMEEIKFLTGTDKFEKMAKKNSNLFDFRNRFSLDIEY